MAATLASAAAAARSGPDGGPFIETPVNELLPWHDVVLDDHDNLLAWHDPNRNGGYDRVLRIGWHFIERAVPRDPVTGLKVYLLWTSFTAQPITGGYWQHNPAGLYASFVDSLLGWYPYSGDRNAIAVVKEMLDYQLEHGTTPPEWAWPGVPFPTSCAGVPDYGGCLAGAAPDFDRGIEPDKVGLLGLGYLRFYELTEESRYLDAAIAAANALARHVRPGDGEHTPWPFRLDGETGEVVGGAEFGGMVVAPVRLFDELVRLGVGDTAAYARARELAWRWLFRYPLNSSSRAWNRWSGFYEDIPYDPENVNQALAAVTATYLLTHDAPGSVDPFWADHTRALVEWVRSSFGRGPFYGAWGIDEQRSAGGRGCCSSAGTASATARWAAVNALLYARTGDPAAREAAFRSLNYATYFARTDGRITCCGRRAGKGNYWFNAGYAGYLRSFTTAMAAIPELAPEHRNHLLGSTSVVQAVSYAVGSLAYRTFDARGTEVLRLTSRPRRVVADGRPLPLRDDLSAEGYAVQPLAVGDVVIRIRREAARSVEIDL
jgi:hypothetical protein